jgi:hypothetical protein
MSVRTWGEFAKEAPDLAAFGAELLLGAQVAYLATVRPDGVPRVHPVTPILTDDGLFLFMEPTSPKGHELRSGSGFSMHNAVPDMNGTGGEFIISGTGFSVESPQTRATVSDAARFKPADRYVLFELKLAEARCNGYGDVQLPATRRWSAAS